MSDNGKTDGTLGGISASIAYFSMEICLEQAIPTYSGGLGVLAGDTLRSAADLGCRSSASRCCTARATSASTSTPEAIRRERPVGVAPGGSARAEVPQRASVVIEGRDVHVRAWQYSVRGVQRPRSSRSTCSTPHLPENAECDRTLTDYLYGGDAHYRLCQEIVLGMGGARAAARARLRRRRATIT